MIQSADDAPANSCHVVCSFTHSLSFVRQTEGNGGRSRQTPLTRRPKRNFLSVMRRSMRPLKPRFQDGRRDRNSATRGFNPRWRRSDIYRTGLPITLNQSQSQPLAKSDGFVQQSPPHMSNSNRSVFFAVALTVALVSSHAQVSDDFSSGPPSAGAYACRKFHRR